MGVSAVSAATTTTLANKPERIQVEPQRTAVTRADLRGAIARAHEKLTGRAATPALLDTLTAHASLETGSGGAMYNYNFGGIKGAGPTGMTAVCRTKEVFDGKEVEVRDGFRAYRTLDEGALDYVRLMKDRFGGAVSRAESGDVGGFAHALKQAHYYTADETKYASALEKLSGVTDEGKLSPVASLERAAGAFVGGPLALPNTASAIGGGGGGDPSAFPDSLGLGRVLDAIARHPVTVRDSDEDD
jgi:hypothetical protein